MIPIGGDDTLSVGSALSEHFTTTFVTKTIDNDVGINCPEGRTVDYTQIVNYFCPGFPSAANLVAKYTQDIRTTAYSHNRIIFVETMGRYAGWLTLSSAYGNADLILIPEMPYDPDKIAEIIDAKYIDQGHLVVVVSEGISDADGNLITESAELDSFGHARPGGCSEVIAEHMKTDCPIYPLPLSAIKFWPICNDVEAQFRSTGIRLSKRVSLLSQRSKMDKSITSLPSCVPMKASSPNYYLWKRC